MDSNTPLSVLADRNKQSAPPKTRNIEMLPLLDLKQAASPFTLQALVLTSDFFLDPFIFLQLFLLSFRV